MDALSLARSLPESAWEPVVWREGTKGTLSSRFARLSVRVAHRDYNRRTVRPTEWLLVEWPKGPRRPSECPGCVEERLATSTHQSGDTCHQGKLKRNANHMIQALLV